MGDSEAQRPERVPVDPNVVTDIVSKLKNVIVALDEFNSLLEAAPPELKDNELLAPSLSNVRNILQYAKDVLAFLQSPTGQQLTRVVANYLGTFRALANISAGVICTSFFVHVGETLLELKDQSLSEIKGEIRTSIEFVREKVPRIQEQVDKTASLLHALAKLNDRQDFEKCMQLFQLSVSTAKLDIEDCHARLQTTTEMIIRVKGKLEGHSLDLNSSAVALSSVAVFSAGAWFKFPSYSKTSFGFGVLSSLAAFYCLYCKRKNDKHVREFVSFGDTHNKLNQQLERLQKRLDSQEDNAGELRRLSQTEKPSASGLHHSV